MSAPVRCRRRCGRSASSERGWGALGLESRRVAAASEKGSPEDPRRAGLHAAAMLAGARIDLDVAAAADQQLRAHLENWLAHCCEGHEHAGRVPAYVERKFRRYLECGVLAHGFARARCGQCGHDFPIALSCTGRGTCPSCSSRRMVAGDASHRSRLAKPARAAMGSRSAEAAALLPGTRGRAPGCRLVAVPARWSLGRAAEVASGLSTRRRRGIATRRSPRQSRLGGTFRSEHQRPELAESARRCGARESPLSLTFRATVPRSHSASTTETELLVATPPPLGATPAAAPTRADRPACRMLNPLPKGSAARRDQVLYRSTRPQVRRERGRSALAVGPTSPRYR